MRIIGLKTASSEARIVVGEGAAEEIGKLVGGGKAFVVTDENVYGLYGELFTRFFSDSEIFVLKAGEENKTFENLGRILERMAAAGLHRTSKLFVVGGGVAGDIGGLAAALYMRGIPCVQVPTTLLAQTDSGAGGKTAVDLGGVKNVVGAFYQPCEVLVDPLFLGTLPEREIKCGLGEIVKYAALDREIFSALESAEDLSDPEFLSSLVYPCLRYKTKVVEADERETGERKSLNIGHTTGHAIELSFGLSHGESVLWGMLFETKLAEKYGVCEKAYGERLIGIVRRALALRPLEKPDFAGIGEAAKKALADKKNADDGRICMSLPKAPGEWTPFSLPFGEYRAELEAIVAENR